VLTAWHYAQHDDPPRLVTAFPTPCASRASSRGLTELRRPTPLVPDRHEREQFDSGEPVLDEWLRRYAGQNRRRDTAATWVIADASDTIVAYASIAITAIDRSAAPASVAKQAPDPGPALLLGRLAVDRRHSGKGIGTALVRYVLATAVELNTRAACRAVVVSALNDGARRWWEHVGFHPFDVDDAHPPDLHLLTADIETTLRAT
jgi:GNAT superfamily N-acetyltransferase